MKQTLHTSHKFFKLALLCLMAITSWGGNYAWAQEVAYKTLSFPDENKEKNKVSAYTKEWTAVADGYTWTIANFNNNQWGNNWTYIKAGSKKNASVATISNTTAFDKPIYKVVVTYNEAIDQSYVNSISLEVSSDAKFSNIIETVSQKSYSKGEYTFNITNPKANQYFRLKYDLKKGKNNGFVEVKKIEYFDNSSSNKTATALSFETATAKISKGQTLQNLPILKAGETTLTGETYKWTSDNEDVATVAEDGTVTGVGVGKANIKAIFEGNDTYEKSEASYEINVIGKENYKVVLNFTNCDKDWGISTTANKKEASYTNAAGYTITFNASSTYGHKKQNEAIIFGKKDATLSLPAFPFAVSKIEVFGSNGGSSKVTQNIFVGDEAVSTQTTSAQENHVYEIAEDYQAAGNIYTIKVTNANNTQISKIIVYSKEELAGTISIATDEGYGTYYTDNNIVLPQGLTAFGYISVNGDGSLNKSEEYVAGDIVPANTAVVVKGNKGDYDYYATDADATKTIDGNLLKGVTETTKIDATSGVKRYILTRADNGALAFYQTTTGNINVKANRAYLEIPEALAVAAFNLEAPTTGINNAVATAKKAQGIYTLGGVRLKATTTQGLPAGAYIVDGKVVIVK